MCIQHSYFASFTSTHAATFIYNTFVLLDFKCARINIQQSQALLEAVVKRQTFVQPFRRERRKEKKHRIKLIGGVQMYLQKTMNEKRKEETTATAKVVNKVAPKQPYIHF